MLVILFYSVDIAHDYAMFKLSCYFPLFLLFLTVDSIHSFNIVISVYKVSMFTPYTDLLHGQGSEV